MVTHCHMIYNFNQGYKFIQYHQINVGLYRVDFTCTSQGIIVVVKSCLDIAMHLTDYCDLHTENRVFLQLIMVNIVKSPRIYFKNE